MLLMFEEGIRGGMCQSIIKYASANHKYMKDYNKKIISSYLMYSGRKQFVWVGND